MAAGGKITTLAACTASNITNAPKSGLPVPYNVKVQAKGKSLDAPGLNTLHFASWFKTFVMGSLGIRIRPANG